MIVYRIVHKSFSTRLYASGMEGRWNSAGKKVIYCAESIPLAFLENMIRRQGVGFNDHFRIMMIHIPENLEITFFHAADLKRGWRSFKDYSKCQVVGDRWYGEAITPVLKIPSAVIPEAYNYVINTIHPGFKRIRLTGTTPLVPDERIEDILKKYPHRDH